jgi:glycosyltransferase involved in cell wall biosynthesis
METIFFTLVDKAKKLLRLIKFIVFSILEYLLIFPLFISAIFARFFPKRIDVGLGPYPLINNVYHKIALQKFGFSAETFVNQVYFIIDKFDFRGDLIFPPKLFRFTNYFLFIRSIFLYRCLYIYFNGGSLGNTMHWKLEPLLYKIARVKIVVMPYGADLQDLTRTNNFLFKHSMSVDYPSFRFSRLKITKSIDLWTKYGDFLISGCDWVEYMYHWDRLMLAHFSIDTDLWKPLEKELPTSQTLRILHAPNHRNIKGTKYFIEAVNQLKEEGCDVELVIMERMPNEKVREAIATVDVVADQLIIGWYAMFALEAMAMAKPVLCYLRSDFEQLYIFAELVEQGEIPIINCSIENVKDKIRQLTQDKAKLLEIGKRSREFVIKHHSIESVGKTFAEINQKIGIFPTQKAS